MKEQEEKEEKASGSLYVSILAVLILLVAIFGISFATITFTKKSEDSNTIRTGVLRLSYQEDTNGIHIEEALPTPDDVGKKLSGVGQYFDFTVGTTISGKATIAYEISAEKDVNSTLRNEQVKLYLEKKEGALYEEEMAPTTFTPLSSTTEWGTEKGTMLLASGTSSHTEEIPYRLRMWIKQDAVLEGVGLSFTVRVNVKGGVVTD